MKSKAGWAVLVVVAAVPLFAARTGSISGTVRDSGGVPQMGAAVEIAAQAPEAVALVVYTDNRGHYSAGDLAPGRYQLEVTQASYLPTLRPGLSLRAGANLVINLTVNTLFEALQVMPVHSRAADEQDDWKWTLRSMANRPILRILDGSPVVVSESGAQDQPLKARVELMTGGGDTVDALGHSAEQSASFAVESSVFSTDKLNLNGEMGATLQSPAVLRLAYTHQFASGERPQIALTARRFLVQTNGGNRSELDAYSITASDLVRLSDFAELEYGTEYQTIQFLGRAAALRPFGSLDLHLSPNTVLEYRYASARPSTRLEKGFDSAPADLSESDPRVSSDGFSTRLENARHQELSLSQRVGENAFQIAGFTDRVQNAALLGVGDSAADDSGLVLADPFSQTFSYFGGRLSTGGVRAVAQRHFSSWLTGTLDAGYGGVLALPQPSGYMLGAQPAGFSHLRAASLGGKLAGQIACTKTNWLASYEWSNAHNALTPVDEFNASPGEMDPFLNLFVRQPLPSPNFLGGQMEVLVDLRNLLAQGYVPVLGQDGHTVYLVQSARSIRGGIAFNF